MSSEERISKKDVVKKTLKIVGDALLFIIIALALFVLVVSVTSKKDTDGTATVFGRQLRFVQSSSMERCDETDVSGYEIKSIPIKSCVFIEVVPEDDEEKSEWYKGLKVGEVLTVKYVYTKQETITHRIVKIQEKETGGYLITLEGDNKTEGTELLSQTIDTSQTDSPNYVIGKVTGQSYLLGLLVYALKTPVGIVCIIIVPSVIVLIFEVMRLVKVFGGEKKEKLAEKQKAQEQELEELKRQLEELQRKQSASEEE